MESGSIIGPNRTFVHHDGALGDVLLSLAVLREIRNRSSMLHFAGRPDMGILFRECGLADEISPAGAARYAPLHSGRIGNDLTGFFRAFDHAVLFTVDPSAQLGTSLSSYIPETAVILTIPPRDKSIHVSDFRSQQFLQLHPPADGRLLPVPREYQELAGALLGRLGYDGSAPVIAVHPGSGSREKSWPLERFFAVIDRLRAANDPFMLLLSGPAEDEALKDRIEAFSRSRQGIAHLSDPDLVTVAALLSASDLFIGNDSGAGHLAAAAGCPVLALFGPTDPVLWRPRGRRVEVLAAPALAEIEVSQVYSRALSMLAPEKS
ncbi:MAG: hypothetical protein OEW15_00555 [Nitrospirota bacterium]|nr:hypothetical protein [Nitrospirota bacterium]